MRRPPVFFDFDGTLVDTLPGLRASVNALRSWHDLDAVGPEQVQAWIGGGIEALLSAAVPGARVDEAFKRRFLDHYLGSPLLDSRPYAGIEDLLDTLAGDGVPLAIVTNKNEVSVARLLERLGWSRRFGAVVCPRGALRKPDPEFVALAVRQLRVPAGVGSFVGDSEFDVEAGRAAGLRTVAVSWGYRATEALLAAEPDVLATTVDELARTLRADAAISA